MKCHSIVLDTTRRHSTHDAHSSNRFIEREKNQRHRTTTKNRNRKKEKKTHYYYQIILLFCSFSVDRVSHNDEAKLNRMRRRDPLPVASKEMGMGGVAVVEKPWLTKVGRRRQTG